MRKRLFIIGAGGFARELEATLETDPRNRNEWELSGFLYSGENPLCDYPTDLNIAGDWKDFSFLPEDMVLLAVVDPAWKKEIYRHLLGKVKFLTYIHPGALVYKFAKIGEGTVICPNSIISCNVQIDPAVTINIGSQIGHDAKIGAFSSLMANVDIGGWCDIGESVFMGTKSVLAPRKSICNNVNVSIGSVVVRSIRKPCTLFGNPAEEL